MKRHEIFPGAYFKAADLDEPVRLTIGKVVQEMVGENKELKTVLYGDDDSKGVVMNVTRYDIIAAAYGEETNDWRGYPIELFRGSAMFGGKRVSCVAVRIPAATPANKTGPGDDGGDEFSF